MQDGIIGEDAYSAHFTKIARETAFVSRAVSGCWSCRAGKRDAGAGGERVSLLDPALEAVESLEESLLARGMELTFAGLDGSVRVGGTGDE